MAVVDRLVGALVTTAGVVLVACLVGIVVFTCVRGIDALSHLNFYTQTTAFIGPEAAARPGRHLRRDRRHPRAGRDLGGHQRARSASPPRSTSARCAAGWPRSVRTVVEAMSAVPTIVAGLFIYSMLILKLGPGAQRLRRLAGPEREHDPGRHHDGRGRAPAGAQRPARGVAGPRHHAVADRTPRGAARPPGPAWSPRCCSASPGSSARPRRCCWSPAPPTSSTTTRRTARSCRCRCSSSPRCGMPLDIAIARAFGAAVVLLVLVVVLFALARIIGGRPPGHCQPPPAAPPRPPPAPAASKVRPAR